MENTTVFLFTTIQDRQTGAHRSWHWSCNQLNTVCWFYTVTETITNTAQQHGAHCQYNMLSTQEQAAIAVFQHQLTIKPVCDPITMKPTNKLTQLLSLTDFY